MLSFCIQINLRVSKGSHNFESKTESSKGDNIRIGFSGYAKKEIEHTYQNHGFSTAKNYSTALRSFLKFRKGKDVALSKINGRLIDDFEKWLKENGICLNTISCYMRSLRAVYNKAVSNGLTEQRNPFKNVFTDNIAASCAIIIRC